MINLTRMELGDHRKLLTKLDVLTLQLNYTLYSLMTVVDANHKLTTQILGLKSRISILRSGKDTLRHDLALLYKYLESLASQEVTATLISPVDLRDILFSVKENIREHPRLGLPEDPKQSLWNYYSYLKLVPLVLDEYMVVVLQIPLADVSSSFHIYEAHNLPALHPELKVNFQYQLEGKYLGVSNDGEFFMLPQETDILACQLTRGYWCKLRTAMYPVKHVNWCIASLFRNEPELIQEHCRVSVRKQTTNLAFNLRDNVWAISSLVDGKLQLRCLRDTSFISTEAPFQIIHIPNTCEVYATDTLFIPPSTQITVESPTNALIGKQFLGFSTSYVPVKEYAAFKNLELESIPSTVLEQAATDLSRFDSITMPEMMKRFEELDPSFYEDGFFSSWTGKLVIILCVVSLLIIVLTIMMVVYRKYTGRPPIPESWQEVYGRLTSRPTREAHRTRAHSQRVDFKGNKVFLPAEGEMSVFPSTSSSSVTKKPTLRPLLPKRNAPMAPEVKKEIKGLLSEAAKGLEEAHKKKKAAQLYAEKADEYAEEYEIVKAQAIKKGAQAKNLK